MKELPMELQMVVCHRCGGIRSKKNPRELREAAFRALTSQIVLATHPS